ncbi:MAG TPA: transcriptional regulator, partial [Firmicutes bacterium]|nr:transcriptional regulator [Bacillota bacterium]HJA96091.1 transcriptional regulator [Bacillota bacterium]
LGGVKVSETRIGDLGLKAGDQIRFRIAVPEDAEHCGGVTIFGKGFGDYDEGIVCSFICK